jgi:hypothetical protein
MWPVPTDKPLSFVVPSVDITFAESCVWISDRFIKQKIKMKMLDLISMMGWESIIANIHFTGLERV